MFRRFMALMLILALGLCMLGAEAYAGSIIHKVHGDVSEFEVQEEGGMGSANVPGASLGTDIYLYVDPYSASYVTFVVVDEDGEPIPGAKIYLGYDGEAQFYGATDENGRFSTYLFRDTYYYYKVMKYGYRSTSGTFKAREDTKTVRVVLRQLHSVDIIVLENGKPVPGIAVEFNGVAGKTGNDGSASFEALRGEYEAVITLPDGTKKIVTIVVDGDTIYVVDIGTENWPEDVPPELMDGGAGMGDLFIVFDKYYHPEDYDLICKVYTDEEIRARLSPEIYTPEQMDDLVRAWHAENPDYLHITAEPDKIQHEDAPDEIVLDKETGEAVYSQRSLILSGWQLLNIENEGMESILFENEEMGVWFDIADLHSEDMARLFELMKKIHAEPEKYPWCEAGNFEAEEVPYYALPNVWRWMDPEEEYREGDPAFTRADFGNTRMELRITPILAEEVERAALALEKNIYAGDMGEIVLVSDELRSKWMREYLADGHMSDTEFAELKDLCAHSTAYRVQLFMFIDDEEVNITPMAPSMEIRFDVNEDIIAEAEEYAWNRVAAIHEAQTGKNKKSMEEIAAQYWDGFHEEYLSELYAPRHESFTVENQGWQLGEIGYETFPASSAAPVELSDHVTDTEEFLRALNGKLVDIFDVDVRHADYRHNGKRGYSYYPVVSCTHDVNIPVVRDWHVEMQSNLSALHVIRELGCTCVEELRQAILEK